jgi:dolichyl-diphosphooligosaccharide--protein glycosyltransferase
MAEPFFLRYRNLIIIAFLVVFAILSLWIRVLPLYGGGAADILNIVGSDDPLYHLRQIEQMLQNYPGYGWFEAMTLFPTGQTIHWGPLFTWICATVCLVAGASARTEIIQAALWVPPVLAALMVPVGFFLVRKVWNWKAGLIAAALIAVVGGQFFFRSLAGYLDHHIAEVFFSTIYCIAYIYALAYCRTSPIDLKKWETLKLPVLVSCLAGVAYVLGFLTMPTMILFAFITALTTLVLFIIEFHHGRQGEYLVVINTAVFGIAALVSLFFLPASGFALYYYTLGHPVSYLLLIAGTFILYALSRYLKGKPWYLYPAVVIALTLLGILMMAVAVPGLYSTFIGGLTAFFGLHPYAVTIQEARPWTLAEAWEVFNFGFLLMIGGMLVLLYKNLKEYRPDHIFVLVWAIFIIIAAFRQVRYEYYLAVNIAVLGGICVGYSLERAWPDIIGLGRRAAVREPKEEASSEPKEEKGKETGKEKGKAKGTGKEKGKAKGKEAGKKKAEKTPAKAPARPKVNYANILVAGIICAFAVIFAVTSVSAEYKVASSGGIRMNQDWRESLEWMNTGTPETGVDYFTIYDRETFTYPDTAYGVMSWWDYGHMITYIAKRIPNANPFQAGVSGPNGSAAFFMSQSEGTTNRIADHQGTRYVMTDIEMATGKFWAMATWYNSSVGVAPYQKTFLVPDDPANPRSYNTVTSYTDEYFMTTVARLHNFDGSLTPPGQVYYIEYTTTGGVGPYPVITKAAQMDSAQAKAAAEQYNRQAQPGFQAAAVSSLFVQSTVDLPALSHYRLVHESPMNIFSQGFDVRYVKVFEYVPGARIKGEGVIELPIVTNTGRHFTWRAESVNGEFIVPYSTEGTPYAVKAAGPYRITATGREITVSEEAVISGALIS